MANSNVLLERSFGVSSDHNHLSSNSTGYYKAVRISDADLQVGQTLTAGARVIGITQEPVKKGGYVRVAVDGVSKVRLGNTVSAGDALCADATGRLVRYLGTTAKHICAIAWQAGGTGDVIEAKIGGFGFQPTAGIASL